jgi:ergothioneine biosynthesis protein EgtB
MGATHATVQNPRRRNEPGADLQQRLVATRARSLELAAPLSIEDQTVQAMPDASPTKWHLAHVTWFFETFVLGRHLPSYRCFDERFAFCFNSYYEALGARHPRPHRGLLTRPSHEEVLAYREHVDRALMELFARGIEPEDEAGRLIEIGINHEEQHQELMLTDILALFAANPLRPTYRETPVLRVESEAEAMGWIDYPGGIHEVGHDGAGFAWDNEGPRHAILLRPFALADRLITNGEWLAFIEDAGYATPSLWLADGWSLVQREGWTAPLYWQARDGHRLAMSLDGLAAIDRAAPVCHISYYEADAFARWADKRLPTEFEWEIAAAPLPVRGNLAGSKALRPLPASAEESGAPRQMFGDVWEWTQSAYAPYPRYRPSAGAIGEYNGKFMCNQMVLRGGSCVTPDGHPRATYRNFFYPHQRWQFMGLRLAEDRA